MTETTTCCGRCGQTIEGVPIGVSVDGGPQLSTDPVLRICLECAASLARWLERRRCRAAPPKPVPQESKDKDDQTPHRKHRSLGGRRRHHVRKALLRNVGLLVLLVLANVLVMIMVIKFLHSPSE
jgi:ribosome-binding protein aMBF1 (putative translation factor)